MTNFAEVILQQLGGPQFVAMTGAKNFLRDDEARSLTFRVGANAHKVTHVRVTLNVMDLYDVEFLKCRGIAAPVTMSYATGVYFDRLPAAFTKGTGLDTRL